jgi:branched-chain amino acid transport system substrate-binding protein
MIRRMRRLVASIAMLAALAACTSTSRAAQPPIRIGAFYPLSGVLERFGTEEYRGVEIAVEMINAQGGVAGRKVELDVAEVPDLDTGWREAHRLVHDKVPVIVGSYGSTLALAGSEVAHRNKVVWWETGAVADLVTSRGYPEVFRTGPSGATLARQAAGFAVEVLAPRFKIAPRNLTVAVVFEKDPYGSSVGDGIAHEAKARGFRLVGSFGYDPAKEQFGGIIASLRRLKPDVVVAATYLHDGARFREKVLAANLPIRALIGKCAAFYTAEMAQLLGNKLDGVFVADKPMDVARTALTDQGRAIEEEFRTRYLHRYSTHPDAPAYMGFSGAWALVAHVLPKAKDMTPSAIMAAAHALDLPDGSLPNGSGIRFVPSGEPMAGQNIRALGVVWQWQNGKPVLVWPRSAARGEPQLASR